MYFLKMENVNIVRILFLASGWECCPSTWFFIGVGAEILKNPPNIQNTLNDVFRVEKIESNFVSLKGQTKNEIVRLRLPSDALTLMQLNDYLYLILGDTSEKWVVLDAGQVYPKLKKL